MIEKINKTKSSFFQKMNKIDKPLARIIKTKWEKTQINRNRNQKENISIIQKENHQMMKGKTKGKRNGQR